VTRSIVGSLRAPALVVWLTVLWVGLWGSVTAANVLGGVAVAIGVLAIARTPSRTDARRGVHVRPLAALYFAGYFLVKLVQSNLVLAWEIITPRNRINTGIVAVRLHGLGDGLVTLVANSITLTPGTLSLEVRVDDDGTRVLYVHVLHLHDVEDVRRDVIHLARLAAEAFGTPDDVRRLTEEDRP
jgi:multicomponent Na+:H+ antiporter subunit E